MAISILDAADLIQRLPGAADMAAQLAINTVADRGGMTLIRRSILDEIAFPKDYLTRDRIGVTKKARPGDLEAVITARQRATSLARFAAPGTSLGSRARIGVQVGVKRANGTTTLKNAWLTKLRNGNVGLAVRIKPGQSFKNRDVSEKSAAPIGRMVLDEFNRQFARLAL
jgi:bifunctional N-acetylglucosamine-1-phosphate-uridyltransferase/glucosamine-1-phosphate-acetyltransferase GlmU-like protein